MTTIIVGLYAKFVAKIAVFDSGLGSLSIIKEIQKITKSEIFYFADQKNFPYGQKTKTELASIVTNSIHMLQSKFSPDVIVVASNTPSLVLDLNDPQIIGVKPPLDEAKKASISKRIGVLSTKAAIKSRGMSKYIKEKNFPPSHKIIKIDGSNLVELVESGAFLANKKFCSQIIRETLGPVISDGHIDVMTLSSTHLAFLRPLLENEFPNVKFIDPAQIVAEKISQKLKNNISAKNSLRIFTSGDVKAFQSLLAKLQIYKKITFLSV